MATYQEGYFQSRKNEINERRNLQERNARALAYQNSLRNAGVIKIVKGVPLKVYSDSFGNVFDIEVCKDSNYSTRNEIYAQDPLVYEKYCNGAFRHATVDSSILSTVKGTPLDTALEVLGSLR